MRDYRDAKAMAQALRQHLKAKDVTLSVAESLELVAKQFDCANWNVLAAKIGRSEPSAASDATEFLDTIPIIRMFDVAKALEFYVGFLGFKEDWRGEIFAGAPLYMQLSRGDLKLHLSEHHGDAAPGGTTVVKTRGLAAFHAELQAKAYRYNKPGLEKAPYGAWVMFTSDPFGNRLRFEEEIRK